MDAYTGVGGTTLRNGGTRKGEHEQAARPVAVWRCCLVACLGVAAATGCSRSHYRQRADREATQLVAEKSGDPRWEPPDFAVYPDERSRFYDPNDLDRPPMPPDDPTAHRLMHCIDNRRHYKRWHRYGDTLDVENPDWSAQLAAYVPTTEEGKIKLDLQSATLLARLHNAQYQDNLEEIYLAALDVAFERFRLDVQFFGGNVTTAWTRGNEPAAVLGATGPGTPSSTTTLENRSSLAVRKQFAAGGELLAGFANSIVWQFAGPDTNFSTSILNFSLVQPLLRQGGKDVVLERLTRAERALLASLRAQAQYRQEFFRSIAVGGGTSISPRRIGGFLGGAGLSGFTGTGGGFGGVGEATGFGGLAARGAVGAAGAGGGAGLAGGGEGTVGGFYGLVQRLQAIRNTETSLSAQLLTLDLLEAHFAAGLIDLVQVDEFRQNIETERANLLRSQVNYQDTLEQYVVDTLGLPPWLEVAVDDALIRPFQLVDDRVAKQQEAATQLLSRIGQMPASPPLEAILPIKAELDQLLTAMPGFLNDLANEIQRQRQALSESAGDAKRNQEVAEAIDYVERSLANLRNRFGRSAELRQELEARLRPGNERQATDSLVGLLRKTSNELQELGLLQSRLRVENVAIAPVEVSFEQALAIARDNRLDWMNRRAALVDQWRLIQFNANGLESVLDLELDGDVGTVGDNPLKFRGPTGSLRARVVFDAPLTRKAERNLYREALINYQRAKRGYIEYVDGVALVLRSRLRQLERLRQNLEIQRRALAISIRRVDQTMEDLNEPFAPPEPGHPPAQLGPTLSQNLLRALSDLRNTQDNFMSVWLNYEAARMNLMIELGLMRLDDEGMWIDEPIAEALARCQPEVISADYECTSAVPPRLEEELLVDPVVRRAVHQDLPDEQPQTKPAGVPHEEQTRAPAADPAAAAPITTVEQFHEQVEKVRALWDGGWPIESIVQRLGLSAPHAAAFVKLAAAATSPALVPIVTLTTSPELASEPMPERIEEIEGPVPPPPQASATEPGWRPAPVP